MVHNIHINVPYISLFTEITYIINTLEQNVRLVTDITEAFKYSTEEANENIYFINDSIRGYTLHNLYISIFLFYIYFFFFISIFLCIRWQTLVPTVAITITDTFEYIFFKQSYFLLEYYYRVFFSQCSYCTVAEPSKTRPFLLSLCNKKIIHSLHKPQ